MAELKTYKHQEHSRLCCIYCTFTSQLRGHRPFMGHYWVSWGSIMPHSYNDDILLWLGTNVNIFGSYCQIKSPVVRFTMESAPRCPGDSGDVYEITGTHIRQRVTMAPISSSVYIPNKEEEQRQLLTFVCKNRNCWLLNWQCVGTILQLWTISPGKHRKCALKLQDGKFDK